MLGPAPATGANVSNWQDFLGSLGQVAADYARFKLIDQERPTDDLNIPDEADLRYSLATPAGSMSLGAILLLAAVVVGGVFLLRRAG